MGSGSSRKVWLVQFIWMATGGGAMSKGKELIHTNVYNMTVGLLVVGALLPLYQLSDAITIV